MKKPAPARPRDSRRSAAGEQGFALTAVMVLLVALSLVGSTAAVLTRTEVRVAGLYGSVHRAWATASAGLEHATGHFVTQGASSGWPVLGSIGGYEYDVTIQRDQYDFGAGEQPVSWSPLTGYNGNGDGEPVWVLTSVATHDQQPYRSQQRLRITSQSLEVESESAFTANASISLRGNVTVSGINSNLSGDPIDPDDTAYNGQCNENKPAIRLTGLDDIVDGEGSFNLAGNDSFAATQYIVHDESTIWHTPEEALGLPQGALDDYKQSGTQYSANRPDTLSGITYITDDFGSTGTCATENGCGNIQGTGILIVHNPLYDPAEWAAAEAESSVPACSPGCDPANIGNINGGVFKGIIIADKVDKINGNVEIYGSVMSMTEIDVNIVGAGSATIVYSCTAIETVSNTIVAPRRLAWSAD